MHESPSSRVEIQRRRSERIAQPLAITVRGIDLLGQPFEERTSAHVYNFHGCRYSSKHHLSHNAWITIEVMRFGSRKAREPASPGRNARNPSVIFFRWELNSNGPIICGASNSLPKIGAPKQKVIHNSRRSILIKWSGPLPTQPRTLHFSVQTRTPWSRCL